jgi:protein involved in polysaccharide export with SLBB domain
MAQGFSENPKMLPGRTIVITRKARPGAAPGDAASSPNPDSSGQPAPPSQWAQIQEVPIRALLEGGDPKWDVPIYPGDVIKVVPAGTFYVAGDVNQPGGFPLTDFDDVSSIQAVAMAGGTKRTAKLTEALIIRRDSTGNRVEQKIDLKKVLEGKAGDARLSANDILFVPSSVGKAAGQRGIDAAIQVATGFLIFGL